MSDIDWLIARFAAHPDKTCIIWRDEAYSYEWLLAELSTWRDRLTDWGVSPGAIVALEGDYSPNVIALFLALIERSAVIVPIASCSPKQRTQFLDIAEVGGVVSFGLDQSGNFTSRTSEVRNALLRQLAAQNEAGLVLFSSGSTGQSKGVLHSLVRLLEKFKAPRLPLTTLVFLLLDHIGGINTLFYALSNVGTLVVANSRNPEEICRTIERHRVELLPTSPTFLNLLLITEAYGRYDLSSLKRITYGTEVMPKSTLRRIRAVLPQIELQQTYGLSELGILRSKSRSSDSLWVRVGGEGYETKIQNGTLWIRAKGAMLGYLNAPSPFDAEGWMDTGDVVEVDGEFIRILGRKSELINVGGNKVYPSEVEGVLLQLQNVCDVTVIGEQNPIMGQIVAARVSLLEPEDPVHFRRRMREYCRTRLESFKVPARVEIVQDALHSDRFKKIRVTHS